MTNFQLEDIIEDSSWENFVRECGRDDILFYALEGTRELFERLRAEPEKRFTVVSAYSDFWLAYQHVEHPNKDAFKMTYALDWNSIAQEKNYVQVTLPLTFNPDHCNPSHEFSTKYYNYTSFTFKNADIPANLKRWYVATPNIEHSKVQCIPFGAASGDHCKRMMLGFHKPFKEKPKKLYLNFQNHTVERIQLKNYYRGASFATVVESANLPIENFLEDVAEHRFVLCPAGNGIATYRESQAIYEGSIPIVADSVYARHLVGLGLPVVVLPNLFCITEELLESLSQRVLSLQNVFNYDAMRLPWWRERVLRGK